MRSRLLNKYKTERKNVCEREREREREREQIDKNSEEAKYYLS